MPGDVIDRALARNHGIAGSPLEKTTRLHAYKLIDVGDGTKTDANLDEFLREQQADPFYADCFTAAPGPAKVKGLDPLRLSEAQREAIASGKISVEPAGTRETATISSTIQASEAEFAEIRRSGKVAVGK